MRALARWGVTPLLAAPLGAWALGFGDIELQSALNQPFRAQIALVATPEELQGLHISLASPETFERYGLDRPEFLSDLEFRVTTNAAGRAVVQVSSLQSVAEPFVTLLVEATHSRGRAFKEYTVLLDPPLLLPAPAVPQTVVPAQTRPATPSTSSGAISRAAPAAAAPEPTPEPAPSTTRPEPASVSRSSDAPPRAIPTTAPDGTYGPVRRAETLWAIAQRFRPEGVSMNRMMVAVYRANPQAFGGNMNVLHIGATLRLPESSDLQELTTAVATVEVQRQTDEWLNRTPPQRTLRLLPPGEVAAASPAPAPAETTSRAPATPAVTPESPPPATAAANADTEQTRRLLELRNEELRNLQEQAAAPAPVTPEAGALETQPEPGVDLEPEVPGETPEEQLFADEEAPAEETPAQPAEQAAAPLPTGATPVSTTQEPSLVAQVLGWVTSPLLWIGLGVAAVLVTALLYVRRRRQEPDDVTGRWETLESEVADDEVREATARMRRQAPEESIVVEETAQPARREEDEVDEDPDSSRATASSRTARIAVPLPPTDETMSSQTVINLDPADPVAEADFHMAYGLYDQAAELVQKALEAAPNRRDLKLKLLEVYFVWGNKDAFLNAAQSLRKEIGQRVDADWDKVVIMGKQICPDERLFAEATTGAGQVDVDLEAGGDAPLDLVFDETSAGDIDLDLGERETAAFSLEATGTRGAAASVTKGAAKSSVKPAAAAKAASKSMLDDGLDIGEHTAAGLEKAFLDLGDDEDDRASQTAPDLRIDSLAITQESPTVERESHLRGFATAEFVSGEAPTVETPTIESLAAEGPTVETRRTERPVRGETQTVDQRGPSVTPDSTAEIDLDDLGLDVEDLELLPRDLGDLPASSRGETDTREQPVLELSDDVLSATGVTQVLHGDDESAEFEQRDTSVLGDQDATQLAPNVDDGTLTGTEVLEERFGFDQSGDTSLVKSLDSDENLDLNLDDLSAALQGADTVEQPRTGTFAREVFSGGSTPLDLDIGVDAVGVDDPTGTEEMSPLDPQTMTEVGTKLDLARAYIDMGDPEGARSILEEVLDEGDPNQRREAQSLIDVLTA